MGGTTRTFAQSQTLLGVTKGFNPLDSSYGAIWSWFDHSRADLKYTDAGTTLVTANADPIYRIMAVPGMGCSVDYADRTTGNTQRASHRTNVQAGLAVSRFDGSNDSYELHIAGAALGNIFTMYFVSLLGNNANLKYVIGGTNGAAGIRFNGTENLEMNVEAVSPVVAATNPTSVSAASLTTLTWDGTTAFIYDSRTANYGATTPGTLAGSPARIGTYDGALYPFLGDRCEEIIFQAAHTDAQMSYVWDYLMCKWQI